MAEGTAEPSGNVTLIFLLTTSGGSGIVMFTPPESPTTTVNDAAWSDAPDATVAAGLARTRHDFRKQTPVPTAGGDKVNVTGPVITDVRANPESSVAKVLVLLLERVPGMSGAVQRIDSPLIVCPDAVFIESSTAERVLRTPEETDIGM